MNHLQEEQSDNEQSDNEQSDNEPPAGGTER